MSQHVNEDDNVFVLLPLPADPFFTDAVDEAVAGDVEEMPATQPDRPVGVSSTDFASLYIRHRSSFALHARRFLNDQRDVDEVLQEAFLRLFLAMPELETELQALAYCRRTVTNLCIDRYRADQRRPRLVDLETVDYDPSDVASYDDPVLRAEDAAIVREALALLSPLHREALIKREIEEKPLPQIAAELDIPEESVKHLLYRARRSLRRLLVGTSVEPGADLSATQALRLANERLARATLRSTNVLIVLFVAAVTVVGALRVGLQDQQRRSGEDVGSLVSPEFGLGGNPAASPRLATPRILGRRPSTSPRHQAPVTTSPPAMPSSAPARHVVVAPKQPRHADTFASRPVTTPPTTAKPRFAVLGSLHVVGPVAVNPVARSIAGGDVTSTTQLVAPTEGGQFVLNQTLNDDPVTGVASIALQPVVAVGTDVATPAVDSSTTLSRAADGVMSLHVSAVAAPDASSSIGSLTADIVLSGDYLHVLSETVTVTAPATPVDNSTSFASPPTTANTPSSPPMNYDSSVIGMSTEGMGDQASEPSSITSGGSFPLLPPPPAGP